MLGQFEQLGHPASIAFTCQTFAYVRSGRGDHVGAIGYAERALRCYRRLGDRAGEARALNDLGWYYVQLSAT